MDFNIDNIVSKVTEAISTKTVIGEPMTVGEVVLLPVMNVTFGFGGGGGDGKSSGNEQGSGAGGGGGARLQVPGVLVIKGSEVNFIPTGKAGAVQKVMDAIPDLIEKATAAVQKRSEGSAD